MTLWVYRCVSCACTFTSGCFLLVRNNYVPCVTCFHFISFSGMIFCFVVLNKSLISLILGAFMDIYRHAFLSIKFQPTFYILQPALLLFCVQCISHMEASWWAHMVALQRGSPNPRIENGSERSSLWSSLWIKVAKSLIRNMKTCVITQTESNRNTCSESPLVSL